MPKSSNRWGLCALMLLLLLGTVACANPADDKPEAEVSEPAPAPEAAATESAPAELPEGVAHAFAEGSTVSWVGSKVTGSHDGGFNSFDGEVVLVNSDLTQSRVSITIQTDSLWSDNENLTGHLKSDDFFAVATHPTASFESSSIADNGDGTFTVTGNLDLHGVTKQISFPATIAMDETGITTQAEFFIKRFDFGIEYAGRADDLIRDEVVIKLDLRAEPAAAEGEGEAEEAAA